MSVLAFNTKIDEAVAAYEAGDIATAVRKLDVGLVLMGKLPDGKGDGTETTWGRDELVQMRDRWRREQSNAASAAAGSGAFQTTKLIPTKAGID